MRTSLLGLNAALAVLIGLTVAGPASAADSHAPHGARLDWLPSSEWVMSSWLPFDEARLDTLLTTDRAELSSYLDDHRSLLALARRRGVDGSARAIAVRLVGPRLASVDRAERSRLVVRAQDMLTQPHLSRHVLFHVFHTPAVAGHAKRVFGLSPATFRALRDSGMSPASIAARGGRTVPAVRTALNALLDARAADGVRRGDMSRRQAAALHDEQQLNVGAYLQRPFRTQSQQIQFLCHPH